MSHSVRGKKAYKAKKAKKYSALNAQIDKRIRDSTKKGLHDWGAPVE